MKWAVAPLGVLALLGLAMLARDDSCIETRYSGGRLVECESTSIYQPTDDIGGSQGEYAAPAGVASIPLPASVMGFFGVLLQRGCETTEVREGYWTVCEDGFSLLERGRGPVAWMLGRKLGENAVAQAERKAAEARADIVGARVEDSDCGPFPCSDYLRNDDDPKRNAYLITLSAYEMERLSVVLSAWEDQEVTRELEEARAQNTALRARLKEIAAHEAEPVRAEARARGEQRRPQAVVSAD